MYEIQCYDLDGNQIEKFYQWDINQKIIVKTSNFDYTANTIAPKIHFTNAKMKNALLVQSIVEDDNIIVDVPNCLLEESCPIKIYFYFTSREDSSSQRTIASVTIPVEKKNKPDEYEYEENVTEYTFEDLVQGMVDTYYRLDFATVDDMKRYLHI